MKTLAEHDFILLRGNHEIRTIQKMFTFHRECIDHLGPEHGPRIWEEINTAFDHLPICAFVDNSIYCAHGGIPTSVLHKKDMLKATGPVSEPMPNMSNVWVWEVMWNDPLDDGDFQKRKAATGSSGDLFIPNDKRSTGYFFSEKATDRFLEANGLSHIIRAHETTHIGFAFHHNHKTVTIFSSSNYCGSENTAAVILVKDGRIRPLQVEL